MNNTRSFQEFVSIKDPSSTKIMLGLLWSYELFIEAKFNWVQRQIFFYKFKTLSGHSFGEMWNRIKDSQLEAI